MPNESDDRRSGVRMYDITTRDGVKHLDVALVLDGEEVLRIPGGWVSRLRALLQRVEADYPGRTGTTKGIEALQKDVLYAGTSVDPSKAKLN